MFDLASMGSAVVEAVEKIFGGLITFLPQLLGAFLLVFVGWLVARLLRMLTIRLARGFVSFARSLGFHQALGSSSTRESTAAIFGAVVFWAVILVFVTVATNLLGFTLFSSWLDELVGYLPRLLSAAITIFVGIIIANLVRDAVVALAQAIPAAQRKTLGRAAQVLTMTTMVVIGVNQVGIDVTLVNTIFAVVIAAFLGGLSVAFGFGARTFVSNLLGIRYLGNEVRVGQRIRVDDVDGVIVDVTQTSIFVETSEGRVQIPGKFFSEKPTRLIDREVRDG